MPGGYKTTLSRKTVVNPCPRVRDATPSGSLFSAGASTTLVPEALNAFGYSTHPAFR